MILHRSLNYKHRPGNFVELDTGIEEDRALRYGSPLRLQNGIEINPMNANLLHTIFTSLGK